MEEISADKMKKEMEEILKNSEDYQEYKLEYMLIDKKDIKESYGIATYYDDIARVNYSDKETDYVPDWAYSISTDVFEELENGMKIGYMSMEAHYGIWQEIDRYYPEDIDNKKGMQKYLKYCKENNITKEAIDKGINYNETPDIMKYYKDRKEKER